VARDEGRGTRVSGVRCEGGAHARGDLGVAGQNVPNGIRFSALAALEFLQLFAAAQSRFSAATCDLPDS
jgi:hypothetical protein